MQKKLLFICFASIALVSDVHPDGCSNNSSDHEATSRTFLWIRPQFRSVDPIYLSGFRDLRLHAKEDGWGGAVQVVLFGGRTTKEEEIARYFLPFGKTSILVEENQAIAVGSNADVFSQNFNVATINGDFQSVVTLSPHQSTVALGLHYRQALWWSEECGRGIWASISSPITHIKNNIGFCETVQNDGGGVNPNFSNAVPNMTAAFGQNAWNFSKIFPCGHGITRLADIELKVGYEWLQNCPCHVESYLGVLVPTGNAVDACHMFSPVVGEGKHWGAMFGSYYGLEVWSDDCNERSLRTEYALHGEYLFSKKQTRSFDLVGKQWSRFLPVYINQEAALAASTAPTAELDPNVDATAGINVFTQKVKVTPGYSVNFTAALVYTSCSFSAELGYNFFARQAECVKLACPWVEGPALKDRRGFGRTRPIRDITGDYFLEDSVITGAVLPAVNLPVPPANYSASIITEDQLDLVSASQPCGISNTFYGSVGCDFDTYCDYPAFANIGGEYEFSRSNNAMVNRWTVWGKVGVSF